MDKTERRMTLTFTKSKASNANTIYATSDNTEALGNKISVHTRPRRPAPISTVRESLLMTMSLNRVIEMCTPGVDENPGLVACPPPFTANGTRALEIC